MAATKKTKSTALDPTAGEQALKKIEPTLRALKPDEIAAITLDARDAAIAALALVTVARDANRAPRLKLLEPSLLAADAVDQLELAAWATWYAHAKLQTEQARTGGAKVNVETYEASGRHLNKMLKLLEYHVGDQPDVAVELADIRSGSGYQDRATDLVRTASLFERHRADLEHDRRYYAADDAQVARGYAQTIIESIRASMGSSEAEWSDLRARAWTLMMRRYADVREAGEFVFRGEPEHRDLFAKLRQVVAPVRRSRKDDAEQPVTAAPAPTGAG